MGHQSTISVKGVGNVSFPPDVTVISFQISALNMEYLASVNETNKRVFAVNSRL